ncbi:MAG: hypothetical protein P8Y70_21240 [Candidatus Lokiarchaeota archaeon]
MTEFEEKVIDLLETINNKLDKLMEGGSTASLSASSMASKETVKPSQIVEKQKEEEKIKERPPIEGRRVCPNCGGTDFNEQEDRTKVLHQQGGMKIYAKKYMCKKCGYVFPN